MRYQEISLDSETAITICDTVAGMAITIEDDVPPIEPADETPQTNSPDDKYCETCGLVIEFVPGKRRGKYHPECRPAGATSTGKGRTTSVDSLIEQIAQLHMAVGAGMTYIPPVAMDGMVVSTYATNMAESWRPLILRDPAIRKFWEKATTGSGWGKVIMAYGIVGMAIAANHGVSLPGMKAAAEPPASSINTDDQQQYGNPE